MSELVTTYQSRAEFLVGVWLLNDTVPRRINPDGLLGNLQPQMLMEVDALAAGKRNNAILEPRRSAKTASLWCVKMGRCWMRPVYFAGYTMLTTAKKANERFKLDVRDPIIRRWRDKRERPVKINESNGSMGVEFENGSKLSVLSPNGDDVRSGAYDMLTLDEGGEPEPDVWDDIVGAVVPSFDTRPGAQLVYAGTGGKYRDGSHFWATLHDAEAGRLRYGVPDDAKDADLDTWEKVAPIIERIHPGLDGLTTLATIRGNFPILGPARFAMEYLNHFGRASGNAALIAASDWETTRTDSPPPEGVPAASLAFAVHPGGAFVSVAVAWHLADESPDLARAAWALDGDDTDAAPPRAGFKLVHHQHGTAGMPATLWRLWKQLRLPIVYDDAPQEKAIIQDLLRQARPRPAVDLVRFGDKSVAATRLLNGLRHGQVEHWAQDQLDDAAAVAIERVAGKSRLIGTADPTDDVTPLEAASLALLRLPEPTRAEKFAPIVVG
ncbi:hypothetical protein [Microbacterium candidum]|uniref:Terminase n=1 Tax=Microbacterium candidum TaxID=3041922 RepID=A0ABT7MWM2_9MICO|nr:hypothetical protein [Microbacterium sp. ASV49]MDL9978843.1 hypothetical protein [Microbacterium sp. ASV49]